jgi:hypothetical protein
MNAETEKTRPLHVVIPAAAYETLQGIAEVERRGLSDLVRQALEEYAGKHGHEIDTRVKRGGNRKET